MIAKMQRMFPEIPPRVLRWSEASFYLSYAQTFFKKGRRREAIGVFVSKVLVVPSYVVSEPFRRMLRLSYKFLLRTWSDRKASETKQFIEMCP